MSDLLFVLLVSGDPQGYDDGFARCVWLRVAELVGRFSSDPKKPKAVTKASITVGSCISHCHTSTVGVDEHEFSTRASDGNE